MRREATGYLLRQFDMAWKLASFHLDGLTTEECLWRPAAKGLHVYLETDGRWRVDWPDREGYDIGPASIAWVTWHMCFWWSMALDHSFGAAKLERDQVQWPGSADAVRARLGELQAQWRAALEKLSDEDLRATDKTRWPFRDRPLADVIAWLTVELTKNASEIGYARFLYAAKDR